MGRGGVRIEAVEYGLSVPLVRDAANVLRVSREDARGRVQRVGRRIAQALHLDGQPFAIDGDDVRFLDIAGLLRIAPGVEVEIAPKFLDSAQKQWREDFFYVAMLSTHGHLLASDRVASATSTDDLGSLVARAFVDMYWTNHRRPLRTYRRARVVEFALDGEVDAEEISVPDPEGFEQRIIKFDRVNAYNGAISAAAASLLPVVRDPGTRRRLTRLIEVLAPQRPIRRPVYRRLPSRSQRWQPLHDLAVDVLQGLGIAYDAGRYKAPGYVLDTARAWEDLLTLGLRMAFGSARVRAQRKVRLGHRVSPSGSKRAVTVQPDAVLEATGVSQAVVLDAKYKGRAQDPDHRIAEVDLYQAMAFARATSGRLVILLYPRRGAASVPPGTTAVEDTVELYDGVRVINVSVASAGIAAPAGLRLFASNLASGVRNIAAQYGHTVP